MQQGQFNFCTKYATCLDILTGNNYNNIMFYKVLLGLLGTQSNNSNYVRADLNLLSTILHKYMYFSQTAICVQAHTFNRKQ